MGLGVFKSTNKSAFGRSNPSKQGAYQIGSHASPNFEIGGNILSTLQSSKDSTAIAEYNIFRS